MQIQGNTSLKKYNTFGIDVQAQYFAAFHDLAELSELLEFAPPLKTAIPQSNLILGGGSNILFTKNVAGLVLKNEVHGIEKVKEDAEYVYIKAGAGENWHQLVQYCIDRNWAGMENLSLIPGNVGASPMQNIGAYGVEIKDVFYELEAYHLKDNKLVIFSLKDCEFGYRESVFKRRYKGEFVIVSVTYRLLKTPKFNTSYGAINQELEAMGIKDLSIQAISQAVINIRSSKLPNPAEVGNAGSFFKNPEIDVVKFEKLKNKYPAIIGYLLGNGQVKLAAGWLIEHSGPTEGVSWKGYRKGDAGCHARQALVLVNYGNATGNEIFDLSEAIIKSVAEKFEVVLEREVNII
jgi:UDP-N-acetylmuramate dehydrogenase